MLKIRTDLKDFQLTRLMFWEPIDSKKPISKTDLHLLKIIKEKGKLIEKYEEVLIIAIPNKYEIGDESWWCVNSELL